VADEVRHEPATGALERLAATAGTPLPALFAARRFTVERVEHQRGALSELHMDDDAAIVLFGSWGRHELTRSSDGDWLVLVDGDKRDFVDPDPAEVAAALAESAPGREELFGEVAFSTDLREQIGLGQDINKNLTRRMLLVLESIAVAGDRSWQSARRGVLESYVGARSRDYAPPRFFLNDLVRYWRTIAVDFEGKDRSRGGSGWGLRSAKLRTSRKLLFASGLLPILECRRLPASEMLEYLEEEFSAPATDRIAAAFLRYDATDLGARVLTAYDRVIALLDDPDARRELVGLIESESDNSALFQDVRRYSDQIQAGLLSLLFDDRRLASVVREYVVF
jgi:predicted nucleotidyltransferase